MARAHKQQVKYDRHKGKHDRLIAEHKEREAKALEEEERKALDKEINEAVRRGTLREKARRDVRGQ